MRAALVASLRSPRNPPLCQRPAARPCAATVRRSRRRVACASCTRYARLRAIHGLRFVRPPAVAHGLHASASATLSPCAGQQDGSGERPRPTVRHDPVNRLRIRSRASASGRCPDTPYRFDPLSLLTPPVVEADEGGRLKPSPPLGTRLFALTWPPQWAKKRLKGRCEDQKIACRGESPAQSCIASRSHIVDGVEARRVRVFSATTTRWPCAFSASTRSPPAP